MHQNVTALESSSYLPLLWNTPRTADVWNSIRKRGVLNTIIHEDSIHEIQTRLAPLSSGTWNDNPAFRARELAKRSSEQCLNRLPFPSTAFQILIGGAIGKGDGSMGNDYLNQTRLCGFLFSDIIDTLDSRRTKKNLLLRLAGEIEDRLRKMNTLLTESLLTGELRVEPNQFACWGRFYDAEPTDWFTVQVKANMLDRDNFRSMHERNVGSGWRDVYHYAMMLEEKPCPSVMLVADDGYVGHVKKVFPDYQDRIKIVNASSCKIPAHWLNE